MGMPSLRAAIFAIAVVPLIGCRTVTIEEHPPVERTAPEQCPALRVDLVDGPNQSVHVFGMTAGADCTTYAVGEYFGAPRVGGVALPFHEGWSGWMARFDARGAAELVASLHGPDDASGGEADEVVADGGGNMWVVGRADGALHVGDAFVLEGTGSYVVAFGPTGAVRWGARLRGEAVHSTLRDDGTLSIFVRSDVLLESRFGDDGSRVDNLLGRGELGVMSGATKGDTTVLSSCTASDFTVADTRVLHHDTTPDELGNPTCDLALLAFDSEGTLQWVDGFDETGFSAGDLALAMDEDGTIGMTASFSGTIDFGGGPLVTDPVAGEMRQLVARFDAGGTLLDSRSFGAADFVGVEGIASGPDGGFELAGTVYGGSVDLGGEPITSRDTLGSGFTANVERDGAMSRGESRPGLVGLFENARGAPFIATRDRAADGTSPGMRLETEAAERE
ncbi:MAG TPA: hypothetical protein VL400_01950 [Polyangiaceae bacterium]|nr:hypothetical protein [Polyangiaceae bacterium]